jgi:hypothetical protein
MFEIRHLSILTQTATSWNVWCSKQFMRALRMLVAALLAAALVYGIPVVIEMELMRRHVSPWFACVLFADLPGCALIFGLGLRWTALAVYLATAVFEAAALIAGVAPEQRLVFATNVAPAVVLAVVLVRVGLRSAVLHEESV